MKLHELLLYFFEFLAGLCALLILISRNVLYAAFALLGCLVSTAAIFIILHAEFVAISQVMIYAGGIIILVIFGVMLTSRTTAAALVVENQNTVAGTGVALALLAILIYVFRSSDITLALQPLYATDHVTKVGKALLTSHALPFEVAGILLLISLIAAAVISADFLSKKNNYGG